MELAVKTLNNAAGFLENAVSPTGLPTADVPSLAAQIIRGALGAVGTIFLILMVYAGYLWMTARGAEDQITKAKNIIIASMIGITIIVAAYAVSVFLTSTAQGAA
jgi:hypothetical protein